MVDDGFPKPIETQAIEEVRNILLTRTNTADGEVTVMQGIIIAMAKKALEGNLNAATTLMQWFSNGINDQQTNPTTTTQIIDPITEKMLLSIGVKL